METMLSIGDVVQLKSGGPAMTISQIGKKHLGGDDLQAWCDWFVQDQAPWKKENGVFPLTSLHKLGSRT